MKNLRSNTHVLLKTSNMVPFMLLLAEYGEEMCQIYNARARPLFFSLNPIVL